MKFVAHMLDYMLDHVLDHMLDHVLLHVIIGFVTMALHLPSFLAWVPTNE